MNSWLENNFLEKLSSASPHQRQLALCSEAEMLSLQSDQESFESASQKLSAHIQQCPACLGIQHRLYQFDQSAEMDLSVDSTESEKRLDAWCQGFLAAQTAQPSRLVSPAAQTPKMDPVVSISKARSSSTVAWALAAAALILLAIATFQLRNQLRPSSTNQTAQLPPAKAPEISPAQPPTVTPPTNPHPPVPQISASQKPVSKPNAIPASPSPEPAVQSATSNPISNPTLPALPAVLSPETSKPHSSSANRSNQSPAANTQSVSSIDPGLRPSVPNSQTAPPLAPLHFPSGVRIWLTLNSVSDQPDGRFLFKATLLLDTVDAGKVLLAKGALLEGSGQKSGSQTTLQLTSIFSQGQFFRLASTPGSFSNAPGSGKTVSFKSGQVLEMWLSSTTTFAPVENSHAYPQN